MLSELRAKWAIKQTHATLLSHAIEILADPRYKDDAALKAATSIANAATGP
jgi:hypothetical protein